MAESMRDAAVALAEQGFKLVPLAGKVPRTKHGFNDWTDDVEGIRENWRDEYNIGVKMGDGIITIDVDRDDDQGYDGHESILEWEREHGPLPETASFITGRGGYQLLYRVDREVRGHVNEKLHVDIRGDGSGAVFPPSIHPETHRRYEWENDPEDIPIADADDNVYALLEHINERPLGEDAAFELPDEVKEGEGRNNTLYKLGCRLQAFAMDDDLIADTLIGVNQTRFKPPLPSNEVRKVIASVLTLPKGKSERFRDDEPEDDELPTIHKIHLDDPPKLKDELICGILREEAIMMLGGASKAGKTFMLMQLAIALGSGTEWLGFQCKRSKVLYVDLEVEAAESENRFISVMKNVGLTDDQVQLAIENIDVINFRGRTASMSEFMIQLASSVDGPQYDVIILDPSYKIIDGDENLARDIKDFTNNLDNMARKNEASIIYCHHHSKGAKGDVKSMDRVSGSGVFARHADAIVDCIELEVEDSLREFAQLGDNTCLRLEFTTRSFKRPDDIETVFEWPCHKVMTGGELADCKPASAASTGGKASGESRKQARREKMQKLYEYAVKRIASGEKVTVADAANDLNINRQTVTNYVKDIDELTLVKTGNSNFIELFSIDY